MAAQIIGITCGTVILNVSFYPRPGAESIMLLHGGPGVPDEMTEVREWLSREFQVITFDQRGIGPAQGTCSFTIADYLNDLNCISAYFNLETFHLFGHSWGGLYAQLFAHEYGKKVLSLFLCSPVSGTGDIWKMTEREIFSYNYNRSTLSEWLNMGVNTLLGMLGSDRAYRKLFRQIIINYHKGYQVDPPDENKLSRISAIAGKRTRREIKRHPLLGKFGKTTYPVMITYGQHDAYGKSKDYVLERFPFARRAIIPDSGHTPWKHNMNAFATVLKSFYTP